MQQATAGALRHSGRRAQTKRSATAYYVWRASKASGDAESSRGARATLAGAYTSLLQDGRRTAGAPFQRIAPLEKAAGGMPMLPLAAYRRGFERLARGELREAIEEFRRDR
jgi:hypothetical protein